MRHEARIEALRHGALFASVPQDDLAVLAESMSEESFARGALVCSAGDPADRIYVVMSGGFEVRPSGAPDHAITLGHGELFGEYGLFDQGLRTATIVARESGTLLTLDYGRFRAFLLQFPEAMLAIFGATVGQLLAYQRRLGKTG